MHWYPAIHAADIPCQPWSLTDALLANIPRLERRRYYMDAQALAMKINSNGGFRPSKHPDPDGPLLPHERATPDHFLSWVHHDLGDLEQAQQIPEFDADPAVLRGIITAHDAGILPASAWLELRPWLESINKRIERGVTHG